MGASLEVLIVLQRSELPIHFLAHVASNCVWAMLGHSPGMPGCLTQSSRTRR